MSKVKLGINGFGRIGRIVFRETFNRDNVEVVAINDLLDVDHLAYLLKYDSVHGRFNGKVEVKDGQLYVNDKFIRVTAERDPKLIKWDDKDVDVDIVAECTGFFTTVETAKAHIEGGAKKVVISQSLDDHLRQPHQLHQHRFPRRQFAFERAVRHHRLGSHHRRHLDQLGGAGFRAG